MILCGINRIDPVARHPKHLQPYVDKAFLAVRCVSPKVLHPGRILSLIDTVLGLEEGHLVWLLREDDSDQGRTGDNVLYLDFRLPRHI
jgi:hypothetical protein